MKKIRALREFSYPENERGDTRHIPSGWVGDLPDFVAEYFESKGDLELLDEIKEVPAEIVKPDFDAIAKALCKEIFPNLEADELGKDLIPNIKILKSKLAEHFDCKISHIEFKAAERDVAWEVFKSDNPDFLKKFEPATPVKTDQSNEKTDGSADGKPADLLDGADGKPSDESK